MGLKAMLQQGPPDSTHQQFHGQFHLWVPRCTYPSSGDKTENIYFQQIYIPWLMCLFVWLVYSYLSPELKQLGINLSNIPGSIGEISFNPENVA